MVIHAEKSKTYLRTWRLTFHHLQLLPGIPLLETQDARNLFLETLGTLRDRHKFLLAGYVVMPEHVHLLMNEPPGQTLSQVVKVLKGCVSRDFRGWGDRGGKKFAQFWQSRFYDFNVYSAAKRKEKLTYMHANPVSRGLVENPKDWVWSSFLFYETGKSGLVAVDPWE
jgi:putative transposase